MSRPSASTAVRFYFDYVSPNAYLAWTQLPGVAARYGVTIEPVPVLFAGLLAAHAQLGPAEVPAKTRWMFRNVVRKAAVLGVALRPPAFHPFNPLLALRASCVPLDAGTRSALIDALFGAVWARGLHVSERAVVEMVAGEVGVDGRALVDEAERPETKTRLRDRTDDAIRRGVFGVPSMEVATELFWGYDDFPYLELFIAGKDPVDAAEWKARAQTPVRASSNRRRFRSP